MTTPPTLDPERRTMLLAAKLRALVKRRWPEVGAAEATPAAGGVAIHLDGRAWVLVDGTDAAQGFARALLWGLHRRVRELHVLMDRNADVPAVTRQADCFRTPITIWEVVAAELAVLHAEPLEPEPPLDPRAEPFRDPIRSAGADPVVEWGMLSAEVLGVQVARVRTADDGATLEVGIGKHDRLVNQLAWGTRPPAEVLVPVVEAVRQARLSGDPFHPLNQLGRERWLRHRLCQRSGLVGARRLDPIAPPRPLRDLRLPLLAPAVGQGDDGAALLVACSVGFDPTFVPMAAELQAARMPPGTPLILALPERDVHPLTQAAVSDLRAPSSIRTVADDWHREAHGG